VIGAAGTLEDTVAFLENARIDVMLFDLGVDPGLVGLRRLSCYDGLQVLALGVVEREDMVIACAEAGIAGYVTPVSSIAELVHTIRCAARGEFSCPPRIAAGLLRRLAAIAPLAAPVDLPHLTVREREIVRLIEHGLSNKEIGKRLGIQVATVKNHVHSILEKLGVARRADAVATLRSHYMLGQAPGPTSR
jgi:DNA-binding NarL/FixJ family response regulator